MVLRHRKSGAVWRSQTRAHRCWFPRKGPKSTTPPLSSISQKGMISMSFVVMHLANTDEPFLFLRGTETAGGKNAVVFNYKTPFSLHISVHHPILGNQSSSAINFTFQNLPHLLTHFQLLHANHTTFAKMSSSASSSGAPINSTGASGGPYVYHLCPNADQPGHPAETRFVLYARRLCDNCQVSELSN
jgi:hypothetical protein